MDATGATDLGRNEASVDNEALIESSFRRLLAAVETERERIRAMWNQIEDERGGARGVHQGHHRVVPARGGESERGVPAARGGDARYARHEPAGCDRRSADQLLRERVR